MRHNYFVYRLKKQKGGFLTSDIKWNFSKVGGQDCWFDDSNETLHAPDLTSYLVT